MAGVENIRSPSMYVSASGLQPNNCWDAATADVITPHDNNRGVHLFTSAEVSTPQ